MRLRFLPLVIVLAATLLAPATASAHPAAAGHAVAAKKVKACKRKHGESKKHWLKRCKCKAFKHGESRKKFKKRCPGAKVPKRKPSGGGDNAPPAAPAPAPPAQSDVDKVTAGITNTQLQYSSYSTSTGAADSETFQFCSGTFTYSRRRDGLSGVAYATDGNGSWRVTQAQLNPDGVSGSAVIHYVYASYQSTDVDPAPPPEGDVQITFAGDKVTVGGRTYDATKIAC
jgi:hypothetical protein